ncbi:MAG: hypothetical protein ACM3L6_02700 [Deltaproteobacteria bacterium]
MFEIDFPVWFCYSFLGALCLYFLAGGLFMGGPRERARYRARQVWQCAVCLHTYFDPKTSRISACPVCGTLNKREPKEEEGKP